MFALVTRGVDGIQFVPPLAVIADGVRCARHGGERSCARRFNVKSLDTASAVRRRDRHFLIGVTAACDGRRESGRGRIDFQYKRYAVTDNIVDCYRVLTVVVVRQRQRSSIRRRNLRSVDSDVFDKRFCRLYINCPMNFAAHKCSVRQFFTAARELNFGSRDVVIQRYDLDVSCFIVNTDIV